MWNLCSVEHDAGAGEREDVFSCVLKVGAERRTCWVGPFWPQAHLPGGSLRYRSVGAVSN